MSYDPKRKRPIELQTMLHDVSKKNQGVSASTAERRKRSACDAMFLVQIFRDPAPDGGVDFCHYRTTSFDGRTQAALETAELFDVWVALAGHILGNNAEDDDTEALKQKRFVSTVLTQLRLSDTLGRLETGAPAAKMPTGLSTAATLSEDTALVSNAQDMQATRSAARKLFDELETELAARVARGDAVASSVRGFEMVPAESLDDAK